MAQGQSKWTERKIQAMVAEGYGQGAGETYKPWLEVAGTSSLGVSRRVWSPKTGRLHHLLSNVEHNLFLALEWSPEVVDIREQYPLEREITQEIARNLGIRHPFYPGTDVPTVMTVDFLVTFQRGREKSIEAFNAKRDEEADDERSLEKLELQRTYFEEMGIPHHLVFHSQLPSQKIHNIAWIRDALVKDGEVEPRPSYFSGLTARMAAEMTSQSEAHTSLATYCTSFDERHGLERGTGLRVVRILMAERILQCDLSSSDITAAPLSSFLVTGRKGQFRTFGGR